MSCIKPAASSGGKARSNRKAVTNWVQTKKGNRIHVRPGARSWMTVVAMVLIEPSSDPVMLKTMPSSQMVWPVKKGPPESVITERGA